MISTEMIDTVDRKNEVKIILSNIKNGICEDFNKLCGFDVNKIENYYDKIVIYVNYNVNKVNETVNLIKGMKLFDNDLKINVTYPKPTFTSRTQIPAIQIPVALPQTKQTKQTKELFIRRIGVDLNKESLQQIAKRYTILKYSTFNYKSYVLCGIVKMNENDYEKVKSIFIRNKTFGPHSYIEDSNKNKDKA